MPIRKDVVGLLAVGFWLALPCYGGFLVPTVDDVVEVLGSYSFSFEWHL